jgi:hypothetical protein
MAIRLLFTFVLCCVIVALFSVFPQTISILLILAIIAFVVYEFSISQKKE